jgi:hypothetical protein
MGAGSNLVLAVEMGQVRRASGGLVRRFLADAKPFSYHAGFSGLLNGMLIWSYQIRKSSETQNWTRKSKNIRN